MSGLGLSTIVAAVSMIVQSPGSPPTPAAGSAPPAASQRQGRDQPATLGAYFSPDDYPEVSVRAGQEGATFYRATVGTEGRVTNCEVTRSSGFQALDLATCRIIIARVRYRIATDGAGRPVAGSDTGRVNWRLPGRRPNRGGVANPYIPAALQTPEATQMAPADYPPGLVVPAGYGPTVVRAFIGRDGRVAGCDIAETSTSYTMDDVACRLFAVRARYEPARDMNGRQVCDVAWERIDWRAAIQGHRSLSAGERRSPNRIPRRPVIRTSNCG